VNQINLYNQMHISDPGHTQAVVQWLGYDAPGGVNVALDHAAKNGADRLASAVAGLQATHDGSPSNFTVIGHSYGSVVTADALAINHMHANNVVLIGSPGAGNAHTAADLGVPAGHVYVGSASRDPVSKVGNDVGELGNDPAVVGFGATRFHAEAVGRGGDIAHYSFPNHVSLGKIPDHTAYYATGTVNGKTVPSTSLQNLSDIATGNGSKILHDGQLAPGRYNETVHERGRGGYSSHHWVDPDHDYKPRWGSPTQ
jgi:Alpha/beta hydrolase